MAVDAHYPSKPTIDEVAAMLRARTVDQFGREQETFTDETSPTAAQAASVIDSAYDLVSLRVGRIPDHEDELISQGKAVVMLLSARLIETVYYPEQAAQTQSAATIYGEMYEDAVTDLEAAVKDNRSTTVTGFITSLPIIGLANATEAELPGQPDPFDLEWDDPLLP